MTIQDPVPSSATQFGKKARSEFIGAAVLATVGAYAVIRGVQSWDWGIDGPAAVSISLVFLSVATVTSGAAVVAVIRGIIFWRQARRDEGP